MVAEKKNVAPEVLHFTNEN